MQKADSPYGNTLKHMSTNNGDTASVESTLQGIKEEGLHLTNLTQDFASDGNSPMSTQLKLKSNIRVKSMLPKTAVNYHKHSKGLYLNPLNGFPYDFNQEALARSLHILKTYGDIIPLSADNMKPHNNDLPPKQLSSTSASNDDDKPTLRVKSKNRPSFP